MKSKPLALTIATALLFAAANAWAADGSLVVLNKSEATASIVDLGDGTLRATIATGIGPHEIAISGDGKRAVVSNYGGNKPGNSLTVIDLVALEVERTIDLDEHRRPHGIVFLDARTRVLVTVEDSQACLVVDVDEGDVLSTIDTDQATSHMVAVTPDGKRAFVANIVSGSVSVLDLTAGKRMATIVTAAGCEGMAITPDGRFVWTTNRAANSLSVIDTKSLEVVDTLACGGRFPIRVAFTPDGTRALVSNAASGDVAIFDVAARKHLGKVAMKVDKAENLDGRLFAKAFEDTPVPIGLLVHPDGTRAYVANTLADMVTVIDLATLKITARLPTGREPDGLGWTALTVAAKSAAGK